jgi:CheY-like chemotaxis protein
MIFLIVEDDKGKERQLFDLVHDRHPGAVILERRSYQSGLKEILSSRPDIILMDMSIPTFDVAPGEGETGGRLRPYGGRDLLREISRRTLPSRVIIVTQYDVFDEGLVTLDELKSGLATEFPANYVDTVFYQAAASDWREQISSAIMRATSGEDKSWQCPS